MHIIQPFRSIDNISLNASISEIEALIGKTSLEKSQYAPEYITGIYERGITIAYRYNQCCYIGLFLFTEPIMHVDFNFQNKNYREIFEYFQRFSKEVFVEDGVSLVSEFLGIATYFEDNALKEISIFNKEYGNELIEDMRKSK